MKHNNTTTQHTPPYHFIFQADPYGTGYSWVPPLPTGGATTHTTNHTCTQRHSLRSSTTIPVWLRTNFPHHHTTTPPPSPERATSHNNGQSPLRYYPHRPCHPHRPSTARHLNT